MAIIKRTSMRGGSYRSALDYLKYDHDDETRVAVYDDNGNRLLREDFLLSGIHCVPDAFPVQCAQQDALYGKNNEPWEVNAYHLIVSYDPRDAKEYLLDLEKAHALTIEWMQTYLPGTMAVVCSHADGDHHTGNLHSHVILHSVKWSDEFSSQMTYPEDTRAGEKLHLTPATFRELNDKLNDMMAREDLRENRVFHLAEERISNKEYWAAWNGQKKLDQHNEELRSQGIEPEETVFRTEKQQLRDAIKDAAAQSAYTAEFTMRLQENHIVWTEENGDWRYGFEGSPRSYLDRTLGRNYTSAHLLTEMEKNWNEPERIAQYQTSKRQEEEAKKPMPENRENRSLYMHYYDKLYARRDDPSLYQALWEEGFSNPETRDATPQRIEEWKTLAQISDDLKAHGIKTLEQLDEKLEMIRKKEEESERAIPEWTRKLRLDRNNLHYAQVLENSNDLVAGQWKAADPEAYKAERRVEFQEIKDAWEYLGREAQRYPAPLSQFWGAKMYSQKMLDSAKQDLTQAKAERAEYEQIIERIRPFRKSLEESVYIHDKIIPSIETLPPRNDPVNQQRGVERLAAYYVALTEPRGQSRSEIYEHHRPSRSRDFDMER